MASVLEQLDLAAEHAVKGDVHNARFALMLSDNAVELLLHQIAKQKTSDLKWMFDRDTYPHTEALQEANGRAFGAKIRFARLEGKLGEETGQTFSIAHLYRNEVYHVGIQHESILPELARFHCSAACKFAGTFDPRGIGWGSGMKLPERAQKYFKLQPSLESKDEYRKGCDAIAASCGHNPGEFIKALANHMDETVHEQDTCLDIVAGGVYKGQETTRDEAVVNSQAWPMAWTEEGKKFGREKGWTGGNLLQFVNWVAAKYPFRYRGDPVASWQKRAAALRAETNPHSAFNRYHSFMFESASLREALMDAAGAVEQEIEAAGERWREERTFRKE